MVPARPGPGRPRKYGRASRAVTMTLPDDVIDRLKGTDADLGRAVVALVERRVPRAARPPRVAELAEYGSHAVIVVNPAKALQRLLGVQLVPIGGGRALISLERPRTTAELELELRDAAEADIPDAERQTLTAIADILRRARTSRSVAVTERSIIVLEARGRRRRPGGGI